MQIDIKEREKNVTNPGNHVIKGEKAKSINFTWKITQPVKFETEICVYNIECFKVKSK